MNTLLGIIGAALLAVCLACVAFGVFMATNPKTRTAGKYFALCWLTGAAAASGILMRDVVTFAVGGVFFCVAGAVFLMEARRSRNETLGRNRERRAERVSQKTTNENPKRGSSRRAQRKRAS